MSLCIAALVVRDASLEEAGVLPALAHAFRDAPPHALAGALALPPLPGGAPEVAWLGPLVELAAVLPEECMAKKVRATPPQRRDRGAPEAALTRCGGRWAGGGAPCAQAGACRGAAGIR